MNLSDLATTETSKDLIISKLLLSNQPSAQPPKAQDMCLLTLAFEISLLQPSPAQYIRRTACFRINQACNQQHLNRYKSKLLLLSQPLLQLPKAQTKTYISHLAFELSLFQPLRAEIMHPKALAFELCFVQPTKAQNKHLKTQAFELTILQPTKAQSFCFRTNRSCNHKQLKTYILKLLLSTYHFCDQQELKTYISKLLLSNQLLLQPQAAKTLHPKALGPLVQPAIVPNVHLKAVASESGLLATTNSSKPTSQRSCFGTICLAISKSSKPASQSSCLRTVSLATNTSSKRTARSCCFRTSHILQSPTAQNAHPKVSKLLLSNYHS